LTFGGSLNLYASLAAGKMAFQSGTGQSAIWSLAADTNKGRVTGALEKLTTEKANYGYVASTPDGKNLTFISDRTGGKGDVSWRDMASGQEHSIATDEPDKEKQFTQINASGTEVFFTMSNSTGSIDADVVPTQGGAKRKICSDCGPTNSLSPDGTEFLESRGDRSINLVDVASGKRTLILQHSQYPLTRPRFSPDGKWIVFLLQRGAAVLDVKVAPFRGATSVPEQDWTTVTPAPANVNQAFWSPDGGLLYYVVSGGGSYSLMARRLDRNYHPAKPAFRVFEFPGRIHPQVSLVTFDPTDTLTAVPGRFIGAMPEFSFNIWIMDLPK
jgi:Tol biopolymer transport system component